MISLFRKHTAKTGQAQGTPTYVGASKDFVPSVELMAYNGAVL